MYKPYTPLQNPLFHPQPMINPQIRNIRFVLGLLLWMGTFLVGEIRAQTVYVTKSGKKYHAAGCQYLAKSSYSMTLADAASSGYDACSRCGGGSFVHSKGPAKSHTKARRTLSSALHASHCQGTTKKGHPCSRKVKGGNRYCWQHGG